MNKKKLVHLARAIKALDTFFWEHGKKDYLYDLLHYFRAKMINIIFSNGYELKKGTHTLIQSKYMRSPVPEIFPNKGIGIGSLIEDDLIQLAWLRLECSPEWDAADFSEIILNKVLPVGASFTLVDNTPYPTAQLNISFDGRFYPKEFFFLMEKGVKFF